MGPTDTRPRMLKDFFLDDLSSSSSRVRGFKSFLRKPPPSDYPARRRIDGGTIARPISGPRKLLRSPSKAASTTVSAFRAMIVAVRNIRFVKSPPLRRNSTKNKNTEHDLDVRQVKITVKDIMRWRSFGDIGEQQHSELFDFAPSPYHHCTATTTTTTSSCTCSSSGSGSSWCDSDFTAEDLPSCGGNCEGDDGEVDAVDKKHLPVIHKECEDVAPTGEAQCEGERHEQSPISVLHCEFERDEEESLSSLDQSLVNIERTKEKLIQKIRWFESFANLEAIDLGKWMSMEDEGNGNIDEEEEVDDDDEETYTTNLVEEDKEELRDEEIEENNEWKLLELVKTSSSPDTVEQLVLLDFFRDELGANTNDQTTHPGLENEMVIRKARAWLKGEHRTSFELGVDDREKREAFVDDLYMEGRRRWSGCKFEEEQNELAVEVENVLFCDLVVQLLFDVLS